MLCGGGTRTRTQVQHWHHACPAGEPVDALLYPSNPQARIELHHNGKSTDFEQTLRAGTTINLNALTCCDQKAPTVSQGLNFVMPEVAVLLSPYTPA